jgi:PmbA protein
MDCQMFRETLFQIALKEGCSAAETFKLEGESFSVNVLEQEIDSYSVSRAFGIGLRVQLGGKNGYAYTEVPDSPELLVQKAMDNARAIETTDDHPMQTPSEYPEVTPKDDPLLALTEEEKIALAMEMERLVLAHGEPVLKCAGSALETGHQTVSIHNTLGLAAEETTGYSLLLAEPVVKRGEEVRNSHAFRCGETDIKALTQEAVEKAVGKLGASPVPPGKYAILLQNEAAITLLQAFAPMFSAEMAQKGLSPLAGKEGQQIASSAISVVDDPFEAGMPRAFDAEGTPSEKTGLVEHGVLTSLLHNLKTAKKAGCNSTSNGGRNSAASPVDVAPSNLYLLPGDASFGALLAELGNGLIINSLAGAHAGVNKVSGDFSLMASGFLVENGAISRPVDQITVAGSFLKLMTAVKRVGSDLRFGFPGSSRIGSPSLLVESLVVSGK